VPPEIGVDEIDPERLIILALAKWRVFIGNGHLKYVERLSRRTLSEVFRLLRFSNRVTSGRISGRVIRVMPY